MVRIYLDLLASIYEEEKNYTKAVEVLKGAIEKFPKEERLHYYLGILYDKMGKVDESRSR